MSAVENLIRFQFGPDGRCRQCQRTRVEHGRMPCDALDAMATPQRRRQRPWHRWGRGAS